MREGVDLPADGFSKPVYTDLRPPLGLIDRGTPGDWPSAAYAGPRRRRRRLSPLVRRALLSASTFTTLLVVIAVAVGGVAYSHYNGRIARVSVLRPSDSNIRNAAKQVKAENFLIIGSDSRAGANSAYGNVDGARSDTTILVHLGAGGTRATIVSFPRDSYVDIPACPDGKGGQTQPTTDLFNSAFTIGGAQCTILLVQKLTGIEVTHYVQVDFSGFKSIVDALGTVTICSPQPVNDPNSGLILHAGNNKLNGTKALEYVRARDNIGDGSDLGRIERQQRFLGVVLRQAEGGQLLSNPVKLTSFLDAATKAVTVDRGTSFGDLRTLASSLQGLDPAKVALYTAPIANRDYSPPDTNLTGKVLLDPVQGRLLYDSIINDRPLVTAKPTPSAAKSSTASSPAPSPAPTTSAPSGITAADTSCTL